MGDLLGSPLVSPLFFGLTGTISAFHLSAQRVRPFPSPSVLTIVDLCTISQDTGRRNPASEIFPLFLPHGSSHCLRTISGNDMLF